MGRHQYNRRSEEDCLSGYGRPRWIASFSRIGAKDVTDHQKILMKELLPKIELSVTAGKSAEKNTTQKKTPSPLEGEGWGEGFETNRPLPAGNLSLEIGFGAGEHLVHCAALYRDKIHIGCEPFMRGVGSVLSKIEANKLDNVRLFIGDGRELLDALPEASLSSAYILFPDPWPKLRHNKRRLVNQETLKLLHRAMQPAGRLLMATDWPDYANWMLEHVLASNLFEWRAESPDALHKTPADWTPTRYQLKAEKEGRQPYFIEVYKGE